MYIQLIRILNLRNIAVIDKKKNSFIDSGKEETFSFGERKKFLRST